MRLRNVALLIAWVSLVVTVAWSAHQTQDLVAETNALLATTKQDVLDTEQRVCGTWLGTYQMLTAWGQRSGLVTVEDAVAAEKRFRAEFNRRCPGYESVRGPGYSPWLP